MPPNRSKHRPVVLRYPVDQNKCGEACPRSYQRESKTMRGTRLLALCVALFVVASPVQGEIIGIADPSLDFLGTAQDGFNITRDETNNLEWLDFTLTLGRSFNDVSADLGVGQPLEGQPIWDLVAEYLRNQKTVRISEMDSPKIKGMTGNPGWVS